MTGNAAWLAYGTSLLLNVIVCIGALVTLRGRLDLWEKGLLRVETSVERVCADLEGVKQARFICHEDHEKRLVVLEVRANGGLAGRG